MGKQNRRNRSRNRSRTSPTRVRVDPQEFFENDCDFVCSGTSPPNFLKDYKFPLGLGCNNCPYYTCVAPSNNVEVNDPVKMDIWFAKLCVCLLQPSSMDTFEALENNTLPDNVVVKQLYDKSYHAVAYFRIDDEIYPVDISKIRIEGTRVKDMECVTNAIRRKSFYDLIEKIEEIKAKISEHDYVRLCNASKEAFDATKDWHYYVSMALHN